MPQGPYTVFMDGEEQVAGMMGKPENIAEIRDYRAAYFSVGRFAVMPNPERALFSVMETVRVSS